MTETLVVPDSITPYLGIKALEIRGDTLYSPQRGTEWPKRERLESACAYRAIEWKLRDAPKGWNNELFWVPGSLLRQGETTQVGWPSVPPPKGKTWVPQEAEHQLGECKAPCGIYVVDSPRQCESYLRNSFGTSGHRVLASIALWGQVIIGDKGARGQYAYPIRLVGPWQWEKELEATATAYGIEYTAVETDKTSDEEFRQALKDPER